MMNYEQLRLASHEIEARPQVFVSESVSLNSLLKGTQVEILPECGWWRDELNIGESNVRIFAQDHGDVIEYLTVIPVSFGGNQLDQLLTRIAPFKEGVTHYGVLADWQALDEKKMAGLMRAHRNVLGAEAWEQFAQNQPLWSEILSDFHDKDMKLLIDRYFTKDQLTQRFISQMARADRIAKSVWGGKRTTLDQFPLLADFFARWWREVINKDDGEFFNLLSWEEKWNLAVSLLEQESEENQTQLLLDYGDLYQHTVINFDNNEEVFEYGEGRLVVKYSRSDEDERLQVKKEDRVFVDALLGRDDLNRIVWQIPQGKMLNRDTMFPIIHWQRNKVTGERQWLMDFVDETEDESIISKAVLQMMRLYEQSLQSSGVNTDGQDKRIRFAQRANPLLGIGVVSLAEPDILGSWPKEEGFSPHGPVQKMGRAQVPIKLLTEQRLLESSVLADIENYVGHF